MRSESDILEHLLYKLNLALYVIQGTQRWVVPFVLSITGELSESELSMSGMVR